MKKVFMLMALLALPFAMQAQTKFHDVEANDAKGAVKSIKTQMMGRDIVINFTDGTSKDIHSSKDNRISPNVIRNISATNVD